MYAKEMFIQLGMISEEDKTKIVHIKATTEFEKYKDGYKVLEKESQ